MLDSFKKLAEEMYDRKHWQPFLRTTAPNPVVAGLWSDLSVGGGSPRYNAYTGSQLEATPVVNTGNVGIHTGPEIGAGEEKFLTGLGLMTSISAIPITYQLVDYLLFYPLIDGDDADQQLFDNVSPLPRYADGDGVQVFASSATPIAASVTATLTYTNSDGVAGRTTTFSVGSTTAIGTVCNREGTGLATSSATPFVGLQAGDTGIRLLESIQMGEAAGGYFHLVLCKPLAAQIVQREGVWSYLPLVAPRGAPQRVLSGASLNFLFCNGSIASPAPVLGMLEFTRG